MKSGLRISILAHALLLVLLVGPKGCGKGNKDGNSGGNGTPDRGQIQSKTMEVEIVQEGFGKPKKKVKKKSECKDGFGGIGITFNSQTYEVLEVHSGYPAAKNGIQLGDVILNVYDLEGEPGTEVMVYYSRRGYNMQIYMVREKICTDGNESKGK